MEEGCVFGGELHFDASEEAKTDLQGVPRGLQVDLYYLRYVQDHELNVDYLLKILRRVCHWMNRKFEHVANVPQHCYPLHMNCFRQTNLPQHLRVTLNSERTSHLNIKRIIRTRHILGIFIKIGMVEKTKVVR